MGGGVEGDVCISGNSHSTKYKVWQGMGNTLKDLHFSEMI